MSTFFESMTGWTLLDPWLLLLALLAPLGLWWRSRQGQPALRFAPAAFLFPALRSWRVRLLVLPPMLAVAGLLFLVVALARPVQRVTLPAASAGLDVLLCLDRSSSMTARDLDRTRTRLEVAKDAAARFVTARPDDAIGLLGFARYSDLLCPLTRDHATLLSLLFDVPPVASDGPEDATGIGTAVVRAAEVLRASTAESKVVILLTDGEENVAAAGAPDEIAPLHAAQLCARLGVRVYVIAAGFGGVDRPGARAAPDARAVEGLAERTGGRFYEAPDAGALAEVYASIDALEKASRDAPRVVFEERFLPLLLAALLLLLGGRLLERLSLEALP